MSDLHLEFGDMSLPGGDVLLLPGDVCVADFLRPRRTDKTARRENAKVRRFFDEACHKYNQVVYIMGNHEHYHGLFDHTADILREFLKDTPVVFLDNEWMKLDGWNLFGGTLWTDYNDGDWFALHAAKDKMNDHDIIEKVKKAGTEPVVGGVAQDYLGKFTPHDAFNEYTECLYALTAGLDHETPTIVMTHHCPSEQSVHPRFRGDILNYAFFSNQEDVMLGNPNIKYWFHGHTHDTFNYKVGECEVVCNPRGYEGHQLNEGFNLYHEIVI